MTRRARRTAALIVVAAIAVACNGTESGTATSTTGAVTVPVTTATEPGAVATTTTETAPATTEPRGTTTSTTGPTTTAPATTTTMLPAVTGPDPSPRVIAFYYPWYGTPELHGGHWVHWDQAGNRPPTDIGSDYHPVLGAYDAVDPAVVAQHMAWLRRAGVGGIASSWWGRGTFEDDAVAVLLDAAERYGIRVAFHIEPYEGRSAASVLADVEYLYDRYGDHPAFYRTTDASRWSPDDRPKGLFFVWSSSQPHAGAGFVEPDYWADAVDAIHALPDGGIVIADTPSGAWIDGGHFDGLYQYATLDTNPDFGWARTLPPDAWFVPSVIPGFSARRIGYERSTFTPRASGQTYRRQWEAALATGIEPHFVTITSFNEWHEGTQIEPAARGAERSNGERYDGYGALGPEGYLDLTAEHATAYLATPWDELAPVRVRLRITTSSDWTTLTLLSGGELIQPVTLSVSESATHHFEGDRGDRIALIQPLDDALAARVVELAMDVGILDMADVLEFRIERGGLGFTEVAVSGLVDGTPADTVTVVWVGGNDTLVDGESGRNPYPFSVAATDLFG